MIEFLKYAVLFLLIVNNCNAQISPGGVNANQVFWVKPEVGITLSGSDVTSWADQSGLSNNALQTNAAQRPSYDLTFSNYNPSVYFDGTNEHLTVNNLIAAGSNSLTILAVGTNETGGDQWHSMIFGQSNTSWVGGGYGICAGSTFSNLFGMWVNDFNANAVNANWIDQPQAVLEGSYNSSSVNFFINTFTQGSDTYTGVVGNSGSTSLGGGHTINYNHKGYISEVAIYSSTLTNQERMRASSYLALKHGVTLNRTGTTGNYVNSSNNVIFNDGGVATYWNDIIGIGRDDNSGLIQKQSRQVDDTTRLYISTLASDNQSNSGSFSSNNSFVVMGRNSGKLCASPASNLEIPIGLFSRLEREWKVTNTNFNGTISIDIRLNSCALTNSVTPSDLRLLIDDDGNFTNATVFSAGGGLTFSYNAGVVTVSGISNTHLAINSTSFITLASTSSNTPLPIELLNFSAESSENIVHLNWTTTSELNNEFFTVQRSLNTEQWEFVKEIRGAGNSNFVLNYSCSDEQPYSGLSYYRLKQTDFDDSFTYSRIISVDHVTLNPFFKVFPNPSNNSVTIETHYNVEQIKFRIFDAFGEQMIIKSPIYVNKMIEIDVRSFKVGIYFIELEANYTKTFLKLIKS